MTLYSAIPGSIWEAVGRRTKNSITKLALDYNALELCVLLKLGEQS